MQHRLQAGAVRNGETDSNASALTSPASLQPSSLVTESDPNDCFRNHYAAVLVNDDEDHAV